MNRMPRVPSKIIEFNTAVLFVTRGIEAIQKILKPVPDAYLVGHMGRVSPESGIGTYIESPAKLEDFVSMHLEKIRSQRMGDGDSSANWREAQIVSLVRKILHLSLASHEERTVRRVRHVEEIAIRLLGEYLQRETVPLSRRLIFTNRSYDHDATVNAFSFRSGKPEILFGEIPGITLPLANVLAAETDRTLSAMVVVHTKARILDRWLDVNRMLRETRYVTAAGSPDSRISSIEANQIVERLRKAI